ncbi:MAG: sugar phosphate nucleotidyltransferase [Firmicutes bacterium]|nr:sugar phosphate nucleotidyltransferase [Bacillota bacterium]
MRVTLLSGGSGKRLWPMSNDSRSKQFLKVLAGPDGRPVSMVQRVWSQVRRAGLEPVARICTSAAQVDLIESQLGDVPLVVEPQRRDTFAAIALCAAYERDMSGADLDEVMVVLPVDPFVEDGYFRVLKNLPTALARAGAPLALLGVRPTEPSGKYGYLRILREGGDGYLRVADFVEKPDAGTAARLIADGALWNAGVFCFRIGYLLDLLRSRGLPTSYIDLASGYADLPRRSFDYEVVEGTRGIVALSYEGPWKDLGTWDMLADEMADDFAGLGTAIGCRDTHVVNELGIPVIAAGLHGAMVVATPDGVLVADKRATSTIKDAVNDHALRPMFEERRWGAYRVLDYLKQEDGTQVLTKIVNIHPGHFLSYQQHALRTETWTLIEGSGELVIDTRRLEVSVGDVVRIFPHQWHAIRALTPLSFIEVQRGSQLVEEDILRRFDTWADIVAHCAALAT